MLETEEVDIDYFTPASSTSLARIFSGNKVDSGQDTSLKYVAPIPTPATVKSEGNKPAQCVYASAFHIYEWCNNTHIPKGKLGFAIMRKNQSGLHNIVIYNSEKITLSYLTLNSDVILNIDKDCRISYYDNTRRYWSICTPQAELYKIKNIIKPLNVQLNHSTESIKAPCDVVTNKVEMILVKNLREERESDTDSSIVNKRTKETILKRMATMGQSVLPPPQLTLPSSDSSDSNESSNIPKIRHKPIKVNPKKQIDKKVNEDESKNDTILSVTTVKPITQKDNEIPINDQQIVPLAKYDVQTTDINGDNMNIYISEQRVTNSELRINMNKMGDKLNLLLDKVNNIRTIEPLQQSSSSFQNEIVLKLLSEYETKIQRYEQFLKLKGFDCSTFEDSSVRKKETDGLQTSHELNTMFKEKDDEISQLRAEVQRLSTRCEQKIQTQNNEDPIMLQEIGLLKQQLLNKDEQISDLMTMLEKTSNENTTEVFKNKLKEVMNDTFQAIAVNFVNTEEYSGTHVKNTVASVIKKTTMNALINE